MKGKTVYIYVFLALLPVLLLRDFTPANELRYLSIADECLRNGTWVAFTNHGMPYADKPPLYFWAILAGRWLFGSHVMGFLSLFSLIPAFLIVRTMDRWAGPAIGNDACSTGNAACRSTGRWMLSSCGLFLGLAVFIRMDMLMTLFIILSLRMFYRMWKGEGSRRRNEVLFPVYLFLAVFSKGPMGLLIPLASTLVFLGWNRRIRSFGMYWGWKTWGILLGGCLLWWGWVYAEGGSAYLRNLLFHQTIDRAVDSFHHKEPVYYYLLSMWYSVFPWSFLLIGVTLNALWKRESQSELQQFFFVVFLTTFVMLSFISSKLAVYLVPAFPFWVYGVVLRLSHTGWNRGLALAVALPAVVYIATVPLLILFARQEEGRTVNHPLFYAAGGVLALTGIGTLYLLYRKRSLNGAIRLLAAGLFAAVFVGGWALPLLDPYIGYGAVCRKAKEIAHENRLAEYRVWKLRRPENMDVYLGKPVETVTPEEIVSGELKGTVLILPLREWEALKKDVRGKESYNVGPYTIVVL